MQLDLRWLWLADNNLHGPLPEYSPLGEYLKQIDALNLERNRWAPLLRHEKQALQDASEPLGVTRAIQSAHDWDFMFSYEWSWEGLGRVASASERSVSFRRVPSTG